MGKWSNLTNTFQTGWNHQLVTPSCVGRLHHLHNFFVKSRTPLLCSGVSPCGWSQAARWWFGTSWHVHLYRGKDVVSECVWKLSMCNPEKCLMRPFEPFAYLCKKSDAPCLGKSKLYGSWSLELFRAGRDRTWKWSLPGSSCSLFQLQTWPAHHSTTSHPGPTPSQKDGGFDNPALHVVSSIFGKDCIRYSSSPFTFFNCIWHFPGKFPQSPHVFCIKASDLQNYRACHASCVGFCYEDVGISCYSTFSKLSRERKEPIDLSEVEFPGSCRLNDFCSAVYCFI